MPNSYSQVFDVQAYVIIFQRKITISIYLENDLKMFWPSSYPMCSIFTSHSLC